MPTIAGKVMENEIEQLNKAVKGKETPSLLILGGNKAEDSVKIATNFLENGIDKILTGGVVANIFLTASGINIGNSSKEYIKMKIENHEEIIERAKEEEVDIIGLSGLITPSLDEMCHVASEMENEGMNIPLLIGGATTSKIHTAVKISPNYYNGQAVYVTNASRAIGVTSNLLSYEKKGSFINEVKEEYSLLQKRHEGKKIRSKHMSIEKARDNCFVADYENLAPIKPNF